MTETQPPLKLPRADEATIAPEKLRDYALNPEHEPDGKHKARVFAATLDIHQSDWEYLRDQLLERLPHAPVSGLRATVWGREYEVVIWVDGLNGERKPVITWWQLDGHNPPGLTTAFVQKARDSD